MPGGFGCRKMEQNDARSQLIWRFLDVVELLCPRAFVMENVKALAVLKKWEPIRRRYMERVSELGYSCGRLGAECCGLWRSAEQRAGGSLSAAQRPWMLRYLRPPYSEKMQGRYVAGAFSEPAGDRLCWKSAHLHCAHNACGYACHAEKPLCRHDL